MHKLLCKLGIHEWDYWRIGNNGVNSRKCIICLKINKVHAKQRLR